MRSPVELAGQGNVIRQVTDCLKTGRSVLLFGPEGIGKSAIIAAVARDGVPVVDPFEHITPQQAFRMRRALDRGVVYLAASRVARGRQLGAVGRILWRFSTVRVRELSDPILRRIVTGELRANNDLRLVATAHGAWIREVAALASGRPGFATAMARFAAEWRRLHGQLPMPALAFAATRMDVVTARSAGAVEP